PRLRRRKEPERSGRGLTGPRAEPPARARPAPRTAEVRSPGGPCRPRALSPCPLGGTRGLGWAWAGPGPSRWRGPFPGPCVSPRYSARPEPTGSPGRGRSRVPQRISVLRLPVCGSRRAHTAVRGVCWGRAFIL
ncbi:hypothetical protein Nmel_010263, partial [Mimus melanotis]